MYWTKTSRTRFKWTKKSKFRNIRRLSSDCYFWGITMIIRTPPSAEDRETRKTRRKTTTKSITLTTTISNAPKTSNISNIDKIQFATTHEIMVSNSSSQFGLITPSNIRIVNNLPRPEHLRTLWFDGTDVTEFLRRWNIERQDVGHDDKAKCERLFFYCESAIKDIVELPRRLS